MREPLRCDAANTHYWPVERIWNTEIVITVGGVAKERSFEGVRTGSRKVILQKLMSRE